MLLKRIAWAIAPSYQPLNKIEISRSALVNNYKYLSKISGHAIAPVLKSNAYGHGIVQVAKILESAKPPFLCVDSVFEAYQIENAGVGTQVLVMGAIHPTSLRTKPLSFSLAIQSLETLDAIKKYQPQVPIHIFLDTGMHREGINSTEVPLLIKKVKKYKLKIEGVMSHFAMANKPNNKYTLKQLSLFNEIKELLHKNGIYPKWEHIMISPSLLKLREFKKFPGNLSRIGYALYGIDKDEKDSNLIPVMQVESTIVQIKNLQKGDKVGYDYTYSSKKGTRIAILPMGYNDGIDYGLSNHGYVYIKEKKCPIIGKVSMNITVVDVGNLNTRVGDSVKMISNNPQNWNSIVNISKICKTSPTEILVHLHPSTKREIVD